MARCANCSRHLGTNKVIWDRGKLKSGDEICGKCWNALVEMDFSLEQKVKDMNPEDVVYKLSSFKKSPYRKLFDAKLLSEENDRIVAGTRSVDSMPVGTLSDLNLSTSSNTLILKDVDTKRALDFCETLQAFIHP
jgi:hypothetical protein